EVATLMTNEINRQLGDGNYFDLRTSAASRQFTVDWTSEDGTLQTVDVALDAVQATPETIASAIQQQIREATQDRIDVEYNYALKQFTFKTGDLTDSLVLKNTGTNVNALFGLTSSGRTLTIDPSSGAPGVEVLPQGSVILPEVQQRTGITVEFFPNSEAGAIDGHFTISSGSTGDNSSIQVSEISDEALAYFGFDINAVTVERPLAVGIEDGDEAVRGVDSTAARVFGTPIQFDPDETFSVDELSNEFTITIDSITETFTLPTGDYNLNSFITALEDRINSMADSSGRTISGVSVNYDETLGVFTITSGSTGDDSFVQVEGSPKFGLTDLGSAVGSTGSFRRPVAETTDANNQTVYVQLEQTEGVLQTDKIFFEYDRDPDTENPEMPTGADGLDSEAQWRPLFLDKGELTFDTAGRLVSPQNGINLSNVVVGAEKISVDYAGSTQFTSDFTVNTQSQNGQPNGSLVAVDIADDGLVTASYSNGTQDLKGKIVLATFSTPNGLRQLGDSTFLASNESGDAVLGEPGGAGYGTIRAGARERANVDLTSELVDLITAQRNFQANAKAIETSSTLTSTIINIRG
ncbi:MAG: flagellar hook-basal body complex protein, partial [Litorivicinaceae bacterium]|nr:flagellar hook-basal body complex protein [Litorivicinaceae bacterium]